VKEALLKIAAISRFLVIGGAGITAENGPSDSFGIFIMNIVSIALDNFVGLLKVLISHPKGANVTLLVSMQSVF